jgi:spermidine synthase
MVLHHYYPELVVESTEIDRTVVSLARKYFGIATNDRMKVFIEDGREYLARQTPATRYDIILVDCYTGAGHHPYSLSTTEFYALCKDHLTAGGVVATNLVSSDPLFEKKVNTFTNSFDHCLEVQSRWSRCIFRQQCRSAS